MDCRLNGLERMSPTKIILDRYLKISSKYNIYNSSAKNDILLYSVSEMKNHLSENKFVKKITIDNNLNDESLFKFIFNDLANRGINNLLVETGTILNTLLLSLKLVDELVIFRSGNIIGNDGLSFVNSLNFKELNELSNYKLFYLRSFQDDILEIRKFFK